MSPSTASLGPSTPASGFSQAAVSPGSGGSAAWAGAGAEALSAAGVDEDTETDEGGAEGLRKDGEGGGEEAEEDEDEEESLPAKRLEYYPDKVKAGVILAGFCCRMLVVVVVVVVAVLLNGGATALVGGGGGVGRGGPGTLKATHAQGCRLGCVGVSSTGGCFVLPLRRRGVLSCPSPWPDMAKWARNPFSWFWLLATSLYYSHSGFISTLGVHPMTFHHTLVFKITAPEKDGGHRRSNRKGIRLAKSF